MDSGDFQKKASIFNQKSTHTIGLIIRKLKKEHNNIKMVYLPNVSPDRKVRNIIVTMEPSFGSWAKSETDGEAKVASGFRNFLCSVEDMILHFCAAKYLDGGYHITDVSKIATMTETAGKIRKEAWAKQKDLLIEELELFGSDKFRIIPVGKSSKVWLEGNLKGNVALNNASICESILHYSTNANSFRNVTAKMHPDCFEMFNRNWRHDEFVENAEKCMSRMENSESIKELLRKKLKNDLSVSRKNLVFTYKIAFKKLCEGRAS